MKFLIPTEPDDVHALLVKLALEERGYNVRLLFTADLPTRQKNSVYLDNDHYHWKSTDRYHSLRDNDYDVVWWRRARKPFLPKDATHPDDYKFVKRENTLFHNAIVSNIAPRGWWVNNRDAAYRAESKLLQLKMAQQCGLDIPITLCSNDPKDVRQFIAKYKNEGVIYKPLSSNCWFDEKQIKISYTSKLDSFNLPGNNLLQLTPGIFQKEIKKKYELRVICFGDYIVVAKLNSQIHEDGLLDWRAIPDGEMSIDPYKLPEKIEEKIKKFMSRMGLVFGSLDLIVTPDDDYIFLEVNEQGQFLWIEEINPGFKMLDIFTNFLIGQNEAFRWKPHKFAHAMSDYESQTALLLMQNMNRHVELNSEKSYHLQ